MLANVLFTLITVLDSSSSKPLAEATVTITRGEETLAEAESDEHGEVTLPDLAAGDYRIKVEKAGYVDLLDSRGHGRLVTDSAAPILLTPAVVITGQVFDGQSQPLEGGAVVALVRRKINGEVRFVPAGQPVPSDDHGIYRIFGLPPGTYSVAAVPNYDSAAAGLFAPAIYGSFFELKAGETRTGVNLTAGALQEQSISGKVSGIPKKGTAAVMLFTKGSLRIATAAAETDAEGAFVLPNVPAGDYQLSAWAPFSGDYDSPPEGAEARAVSRSVKVAGGDVQADLELRPFLKVNQKLTRDARCAAETDLIIYPDEGWPEEWKWEGEAKWLPPGRYRVETTSGACPVAPASFTLVDGSELKLTLRAATGEISGTVGQAASGLVALWPDEGEDDSQIAPIDSEGRYRFPKVPAGVYRLMAVERFDSAGYRDALETRAKEITVTAGQRVTVDLRRTP